MTTTSSTITSDVFHSVTIENSLRPLQNALSLGVISKEDHALILQFVSVNQAFNNISIARYNKIVFLLMGWRNYIGEFSKNDIGDLAAGITILQTAVSTRGIVFSPETVADYIRLLKQFYNWLIDEGHSSISEKQIKKIKISRGKISKYNEKDVLSKEQISNLLAACKDLEEKTLISLLYEGALRIGEAATLTWNQVDIQKTHSRLNVTFKTKFPRRIPILLYKDYIQSWHNTSNPGPGNLVFTNRFGKLYKYHTIAKKIRVIGERAGIPHLQPHLLRHTRITHMILEGIPKETVSLICWGKINARELDRYAHLFEAVDDMYLKHYGLKQDTGIRRESLSPIVCPECQYVNPPGSLFCFSCNKALTKEALQAVEDFSKNVTPEILQAALALFLQTKMMGNVGN
jgi:integrase